MLRRISYLLCWFSKTPSFSEICNEIKLSWKQVHITSPLSPDWHSSAMSSRKLKKTETRTSLLPPHAWLLHAKKGICNFCIREILWGILRDRPKLKFVLSVNRLEEQEEGAPQFDGLRSNCSRWIRASRYSECGHASLLLWGPFRGGDVCISRRLPGGPRCGLDS